MGFEKDYPNRKDHRKPYRKAGKYDRTCRPGGSCPYCQGNRLVGQKRKLMAAKDDLRHATDTEDSE